MFIAEIVSLHRRHPMKLFYGGGCQNDQFFANNATYCSSMTFLVFIALSLPASCRFPELIDNRYETYWNSSQRVLPNIVLT